LLDLRDVRETFDRIADRYDRHAAFEQEVCSRLLERCDFLRRAPERILDLGCGTGQGSQALKRRFRRAQVIALDSASAMLHRAQRRSSRFRPLLPVCADIARLPVGRASADMLFSSLTFHWVPDPRAVLDELRRVLRPDGILLFATLGPASLGELRSAWAAVDSTVQVAQFSDLLEIGDGLVAAGFREPVMDAERITMHYPSLDALLRELECTGTSRLFCGWGSSPRVRRKLEAAFAARRVEGRYPLTYEILYGTAFGPPEGQPRRTANGDVVTFSADSLLRSRRMR